MTEFVSGSRTTSGDDIILTGKRHWGAFLWPVFWVLVLAISPLHGAAVLPLIWLGWLFIKWSRTHVILTTRRVYGQQGVISLTTFDLRLDKIESIIFNASLLGKLLGYGTIQVRGTGATHFLFRHIANANAFKTAVDRQIDARIETR